MADNDRQGPPDGYGLGVTREGLGFGYLSNTNRGAVTFQVSAALVLTEVLTIAGSHKTMHRSPAVHWTEDLEIAGSTVTHGTPTFVVSLAGPFGPTSRGSNFDVAVSFAASPTGQTSAVITLIVSGTYHNLDGTFANVTAVGWDGTPAGWTISQDWTDFGDYFANGYESTITRASIDTGESVGSFTVSIEGGTPDGLVGSTISIGQGVVTASHTASATSPASGFNVSVT